MFDLPLSPSGQNFINGRFQGAHQGKVFPNFAPASDVETSQIAKSASDDVAEAVDAAQNALKPGPWTKLTLKERCQLIRKLGDHILKNQHELACLESIDTGKPYSETFHGDIPRSAANFHFFANLAESLPLEEVFVSEDESRHLVSRNPIGCVGLITPWNLPLYLSTWKLAPALVQGNCVILKPAELTPLSVSALAKLSKELGFPDGVFNVVQGFGAGEAGEALVKHPGVKAISFTGETSTGTAIMSKAAHNLKKLSFELGGKGATLVFRSADLAKAAATAARSAFRNQGQICLAGSRLIVEKEIENEFTELLLQEIRKIKIGEPLNPSTTMGSLISRDHRQKVASYVDLARSTEGVEILCGGRIPPELSEGAYFEPTVLRGCAQNSRFIQEEIFGPILTLQAFEDYNEAIGFLNDTPYGLSCSIWTRDENLALQAAKDADTGLVWINSWFLRNLNTPFGGSKRSGIGREGGKYSLDFFSEQKTISLTK